MLGGFSHPFLKAWKLASESGCSLPTVRESELLNTPFRFWLGQILAYPQIDGAFKKGRDFHDAHSGWIVPGSAIPPEVAGKAGAALLMRPGLLEEKRERVVVIPSEVEIQLCMIQSKFGYGTPDPETSLPTVNALSYYPAPGLNGFFRLDGPGVRPIVRNLYGQGNLAADYWPGARFPVLAIFP